MRFSHRFKSLFFVLLLCALLLSLPCAAFAAAPEDALRKGTAPARSTVIDRDAYEDGSAYEPCPVDPGPVKIGLYYGDSALSYAELYNSSGRGFFVGQYNEQRQFTESFYLEASWIAVYRVGPKIAVSGWDRSEEFDGAEGVALVPMGGGPTAFGENAYLGGMRFTAWGEDAMTAVNFVDLEDYIKGVIPYEMSSDWPYEALRAQAVCARTYVVYNRDKYEEYGFDLTGDTESQVYRGVYNATARTDQAVDSTQGQYVRYRGEICEIYYFASDGGATEDGKNVFGCERPYLAGKTDPFEDAVDYTGRNWTLWRDPWEMSRRLTRNGAEIGPIVAFEPLYSELGNVIAGRYLAEDGEELTLDGRDSYAFIGLSNCRFRTEKTQLDETDYFVFTGDGWGHNCGMSQWGAYAMAEYYGCTCEDIIRFYYTGAYVG